VKTKGKRACPVCGTLFPDSSESCPVCALQGALKTVSGSSSLGEGAGAQAVANLRRYSNYLTPRLGLFSGDSLALVAIYLRNLFLNGLILIPVLGAATVLPKIVYRVFASDAVQFLWGSQFMLVGSAVLAGVSGIYTVSAATHCYALEVFVHVRGKTLSRAILMKTKCGSVQSPMPQAENPPGIPEKIQSVQPKLVCEIALAE
jgi:hypothetical protein